MITDLNDLALALADDTDDPPVTHQQMIDWNEYRKFLQKRGIAGDPKLDKNNLGKNLLATYIKQNPNTSLTVDSVIPIQKQFTKLRQYQIEQIHQGKGAFGEGVNEDNFLSDLSIVDGIPGQRTTSYSFPSEFMNSLVDKKIIKTENKGLVTPNKL